MENEHASLESRLRGWFEQQGYSLEMRVASAFREAGFSVSQFEKYADSRTGNLREIDVVASASREVDGIMASVGLFIECKHSARPWVIMTSPRRCHPFRCFSRVLQGDFDVHRWREYPTLEGRLLARILLSLGAAATSKLEFFSMPERPAYTIVEAFKERQREKDRAYGAVMQAHSSALAHDSHSETIFDETVRDWRQWVYEDGGSSMDFRIFSSVAFPVVVIEGCMFECYLDTAGELQMSETTSGHVLVPAQHPTHLGRTSPYDSVVRVVTESVTGSLATQSRKALDALLAQEEAIRAVSQHESSVLRAEGGVDEIPF